jgi:Icc-related predicted phosphoesterase
MSDVDPQTPQPGMEAGPATKLRVAAVGDLHVGEAHDRPHRELFDRVHEDADVLVLCGDLTNFGKVREVEILLEDLRGCQIPMVGVLGNHEHECGHPEEVTRMLCDAGVKMLTGQAYEIEGVGFAGGKGFIGGFGRHMLSPFGEPEIKHFVQASVDETLKLESSLRMLKTERTVVVLHYSPVLDTVVGEPPEIFAFLGSARMGETIDRFDGVKAVFHGHAHRGAIHGRTAAGTPVFNVARPLLMRETDQEYWLMEV